jgi:opine dehydrogenase
MARRLTIAVVGGGHGGYATAGDLAERGHRVRLWRRNATELELLAKEGGLTLVDAGGERRIWLDAVSPDIGEAVRDADLVIIPLPATAQEDVARALAPHLQAGQVVFVPPGTFGSFLMARTVEETRGGLDVMWAEAGTLPYLARKHGPTKVAVTARATRLPSGVFPARRTDAAFDVLRQAFPAVEPRADAMDAALTNAGPIIHPPLVVLNAAPIQHFDAWDIHSEGTQSAVRRVQDALDAERIRVREALGYAAPHYPLADHYSAEGEEWMYGNAAHERLVDSSDWREPLDLEAHRYVREDIACGLALLVSIGSWAGVETPVARGLLEVARAFAPDSVRGGRTLDVLGLARMSPPELRHLLQQGLAA